jgi:hypothetical protein
MAKRKLQKGPSWFEVGLGAALSVVLGVILGAAYLVMKPVTTAKEIPKDAPSNAVYFLEGLKNTTASGTAEDDRRKFLAGESVDVTESEVNALFSDAMPAKPSSDKDKDKAPAAADKMVTPGTVNVRIRESTIQFGCPLDFNIFTVMGTVIVQAKGSFEKRGSTFVFVPDSVMIGGCQVEHVPFVKDLILSKVLFSHPIPDDLANAWTKLGAVTIDGSTLRLKMP